MNDNGRNGTDSLVVLRDGEAVFRSGGSWLHPLFELEDFLAGCTADPASLTLRDKIVGKAAALLIVRLGFRKVHAGIMSEPGREVFERYGVSTAYDTLVDLIDCATERLLADVNDPEEAHAMILARIESSRGHA